MNEELMQAAEELMPRIDNQGHRLAMERAMKVLQDSGDDKPLKQRLADYAARYPAKQTVKLQNMPDVRVVSKERELPDLPNSFTMPTQSAMLQVETLPGYHASLWNDTDTGLAKMKAVGVIPANGDCPYIPEHERKRLRTGYQHGFLCLGDLVVGIETDNHFTEREEATVKQPARDQSRRMGLLNERKPGDPAPYAVTTEKGQAPLIKT